MTVPPMSEPPHYSYNALASDHIRIVELQPGQIDAPLACSLVDQQISDRPYEAISYVWGDPSPVAIIKIERDDSTDEAVLPIAKGLTLALVALRLPDRMRRVWVDAICINQQDIIERQGQVEMMGSIYHRAEHVLCWLGPFDNSESAESRARLAVDFVRAFNDSPKKHLQAARKLFHSEGEMASSDRSLLDSWHAVKEMFDIEYFHRAWIIQEVGLASRARFFWGSQDLWLDWDKLAAFCFYLDNHGASVINHLELKSWVANHINLVWSTDSSGRPLHDFVEVLHWARVHRSTDPRDFIYALLSHPSAKVDGQLFIQPNYTITTAQAYTELARNVINRTGGLQILAFVDHHEEPSVLKIPTWVPDWHALNLVAPLRCWTSAASTKSDTISFSETDGKHVLRCRGYLVDELRAMSDMIEPSGLTVTNLENEMKKKIPFLVDHIWNRLVAQPQIPLQNPQELIASLSLVLTGGYLGPRDSTFGELQEKQHADFAALLLEYERIRAPGGHSDTFYGSLSPDERSHINTMAAKGSAHHFVQDMTWTSMCRRTFRTTKGYIGLGPRIVREGDLCAVLKGSTYPSILRKVEDGRYELVGPALVYGLMNGEAEALFYQAKLSEEEFEIV